ncbi:ATP-grasp domain-containing protein [Streptomyces sp. LN785]|uniref:ATP-grasp domain-containing protein n=1 Tax=Streptomyces sp. LN785 TaxID=3112983 RepID=UPI00371C7177
MTATQPFRGDQHHEDPVVVLGWKPTEVLTALVEHGARVICVCEPADLAAAEKAGTADRIVTAASVTDAAEVVGALAREGVSLAPGAVVCTADEFPVVTASAVGEALGCRSWPMPRALALRDKFVQKQLVRRAGIRVAQAYFVERMADLAQVPFPLPYVVKPFDEAGSRRTTVVRTAEEAARLQGGAEDPGPWLVESFVPGGELHVDGVVRDGELQMISVSRYLNNVVDFRTGGLVGSTVLDRDTHAALHTAVTDIADRSLRALGHHDGVFHLEVFEQEEGLVFGECAGRVGGARVDTVVRLKYGVDLYDEWARAVLAIPTAVAAATRDERTFGWLHLPAVAGRVTSMPSVEEIRERPGVEIVEMKVGTGDVMADTGRDINARAGRVVVSGDSAAEVDRRLRALAVWFRDSVEVEPA